MTGKEKFLSVMKNEQPLQWMGYAFDAFPPVFPFVLDPITELDTQFSGEHYVDLWGASWRHLPEDPGAIPICNESNAVIKDIEHWRDYVTFPSIENLDWSAAEAQVAQMDRENTFVMIPSFYGPFERLHTLMPFDEVLADLIEEPELISEIIGAIADWKIRCFEQIIDHLHPDIIHSHDDWGGRTSLFMSANTFREVLEPHYKRMYDYIHSRGVLVQHHADCYCQGLEQNMVEMGIDMWEGALPTNDIVQIMKNTDNKLCILGGIDQTLFDFPGFDPEVLKAEVRRCIRDYAGQGPFLPCVCSVTTVEPSAGIMVAEEANHYGAEFLSRM